MIRGVSVRLDSGRSRGDLPMPLTWEWEVIGRTATRTHNGRHVVVTARNEKELGLAISNWEAGERKRLADSLKNLGAVVDEALDRLSARIGDQSADVDVAGKSGTSSGPVQDRGTL
ncbi:hypothetical protein [Acrocarpospora sp. B8E8]|uniref:hypothetical protein n=1 Tax=Acrocarpospora sp. B8E8 TaxID=3153572 RepID=UPI00325CC7B5